MAKRDWMAVLAKSEVRLPMFSTVRGAALAYRRYRDRLAKALAKAARQDGLELGYSGEDLDRLQEWSREVVRQRRVKAVGFSPGMLADALELHATAACVRETGALWLVQRADTDSRRYSLRVELGLATYPACFVRTAGDQTFWKSSTWDPHLLRSCLAAMVESATLGHFERVKPHRLRLSPRKKVRFSEIRLLERGFDPWSEKGIIAAWKHESKSKFPVHPIALATDLSRCRDATRHFLQRELAMAKEFNFEACVQALRAHVSFAPKPEPEDSMVIPD